MRWKRASRGPRAAYRSRVTAGQSRTASQAGTTRWAATTTVALGALLGTVSIVLYATSGFSVATRVTWIAGLVVLAAAFKSRTERLPRVALADLLAPALVVAALSPLYVVNVHGWPVQVGSDEIAVMTVAERWAGRVDADLFGLSDYLGHPALLFVLWGSLAELFGDIDLATMRALHGAVSLLGVYASYFLFRQLLPRRWALVATTLLGLSHTLFIIGRFAMRESTTLLIEMTALTLLLYGLRRRAPFPTFLGGVAAGLGYYVYQPARVAIALWLVFLGALLLLARDRFPARRLGTDAAIALSAFALVASPVVIAELKAPDDQAYLTRESLLVFDEARKKQQEWVFADSEWEGIRTNIGYGLGSFNNNVVDHGWIYVNWGHGIVDPLTGGLLWLGVLVVGWRAVRRSDETALLPLTAFLTLWLSFAFLVNKAPNYTRMLIVLPFVAYFVTEAVRAAAAFVPRALHLRAYRRGHLAAPIVAGVLVATIGAWNLQIAADYVQAGRRHGDDIGSTGRYVESRRDVPGIRFYIAASQQQPYYVWGFPWMWFDRLRMFAHEGQVQDVMPPRQVGRLAAEPPFVVFMNRVVWDRHRARLEARYPRGRSYSITPDGNRIAFEVVG